MIEYHAFGNENTSIFFSLKVDTSGF